MVTTVGKRQVTYNLPAIHGVSLVKIYREGRYVIAKVRDEENGQERIGITRCSEGDTFNGKYANKEAYRRAVEAVFLKRKNKQLREWYHG